MSAATTPEERLLSLGGKLRTTYFSDPTLVDWTREVEEQLKELRERLDTTDRRSRRTAYESDPLNRIG